MKIKFVLGSVLAAIGLMTTQNAVADDAVKTWKGTDYQEAVGKTVFLYNVGTGRFLVHGGDWGTQARLFNPDYGKSMTPTMNGDRYLFKTGVNTGAAAVLGCNVPDITSIHAWKGNNDQETFTILMDANEHYTGNNSVSGYRSWNFVPVDEGDGTFTYYMYEVLGPQSTTSFIYIKYEANGTTYYLNHNARFVAVDGDPSQDYRWLLQRYSNTNYYYVYYMNGNSQTWLTTSNSSATTSTNAYNRLYYYNGYIVDDQNNNNSTYYLKGTTNSSTAPSVNRQNDTGTRATAEMKTETNGNKYWLGAAYGENGPEDAVSGKGHEGDPVGKLVLLASGYDKAVWSTADPQENIDYACQLKAAETAYLDYDNEENMTVNRNMGTAVRVFNETTFVPVRDLYKWRIVTAEQILETLTEEEAGDAMTTNLTWMITDRGFERNDNNFFDGWKTGRVNVNGVTYSPNGRYGYTWGYATNKALQQKNYDNRPWNEPVRLKTEWTHKNNAIYGFMEFEGAGTVSTSITAPADGVYRISCYGYYKGGHPGYLFVSTKNPQGTTLVDPSEFKTINLEEFSATPFGNASKADEGSVTRASAGNYSGSGVMFAGVPFVNDYPDKPTFRKEIEITLKKDDVLYFGVGKNGATRSSSIGGYYYDTEYVAVDQFSIEYLGTSPVWFNEDKTSLDYLDEVNGGEYTNQTVRLHRDFKVGKWNSFVFPMSISAAQVRSAFGQQTKLAELAGLGVLSGNAGIIDFRTLPLPNEGTAITPGKLYLIMPENSPLTGANPDDNTKELTYYNLGRVSFKTSDFEATQEVILEKGGTGASEHNDAKSKATYVATSDFDNYTPTSTPENGVFTPAGAYVISDGKMYHLNRNTKIKGFRGWIEDINATPAKNFSLDGVYEQGTTAISNLLEDQNYYTDDNVYDISGRKVSKDVVNSLSKGMYIVKGKKVIIK